MKQQVINSSKAPQPVGPYSHAIKAGGFLFCSGQIPLDPASGKIVSGGIIEQTEQVFRNIIYVLEAAELDLNDIVKCGIYLADMNSFADINQVYAKYFKNHKPARFAVQVARLPLDSLVEIEVTALCKA
ncbi:MAG: RidA family protein [SAR324 cluster bacterium]|nr:RidA family protein [SAR324 cluster bacterium]